MVQKKTNCSTVLRYGNTVSQLGKSGIIGKEKIETTRIIFAEEREISKEVSMAYRKIDVLEGHLFETCESSAEAEVPESKGDPARI